MRLIDFEHNSAGNLIGVTVDYDGKRITLERVRHGRWLHLEHKIFGNTYDYVCSVCDCDYVLSEYNYCPHCGARMDGATNGV